MRESEHARARERAINRRETRDKVRIRDTNKTQRRHIGDTMETQKETQKDLSWRAY